MVALVIISKYFSQNTSPAQQVVYQEQPVMNRSVSVVPILTEIKNEIAIEKPVGEVSNLSVVVTDRITDLYSPNAEYGLPWSSFDFTNNGPDGVYLGVNQWDWPEAPLPVGQSLNIDFGQKGSIKRVFLKCDAGQTSNVSFHIIK